MRLRESGLSVPTAINGDEVQRLTGPVDDDFALFLERDSATAREFLEAVAAATRLVVGTFEEYGVAINLSEGKAECVVSLRGTGSRMLWRELCVDHKSVLSIQCDGGTIDLRIVPTYRHLDGVVENKGDWAPEFRAKAASKWSEIKPQIRAVLREVRMPLARRYSIVKSLYLSRLSSTMPAPGHAPQRENY